MELLDQKTTKKELATTVLSNSLFYGFSRIGIWFLDLAVGILLARYLLPSDYSLFAMALFYYSFFTRIEQLDLDNALMSTRENLEAARGIHRILRLGLATGVFMLSLLWIGTPWGQWPLGGVLIGLALGGLFEAFISTERLVLEMRFRASILSLLEFISTFLGTVAGVFVAIKGGGFWALLAYRWINLVCRAFLIHFRCSIPIGWKFDPILARYYFKVFGLPVLVAGFFTLFLSIQIPLLHYFNNENELGYYVKAVEAVMVPMAFLGLLIRVIGPLYSHYQSQKDRLKEVFYLVQLVKLRVAFPVYFLLFCFSSHWIELLYGKTWLQMDGCFKVLLFYSFLRLFFDDLLSLFSLGLKKTILFRKLEIGQGSLSLILAPFFILKWGALGGALSLVIPYGGSVLLGWRWAYREIEFPLKPICYPVLKILCLTILVLFLVTVAGNDDENPLLCLLLLGGTFLAGIYFFEPKLNKNYFHRLIQIGWNAYFPKVKREKLF